MKRLVVCKFGGSSLADAARFRRVAEILRRNPARKYIVVSAPGARFPGDAKLTDRLLRARLSPGWAREREWAQVCARFREIAWGLSLDAPEEDLEKARAALEADWAAAASRGEWLCARMLAAYLKLPFVDAAEVIRFRAGVPDPQASYALLQKLPREGAVLPGFYGAEADGSVAVFPRGGSDITGAWAAAALQADAYENWTDVDGFFSADPALVTGARPIAELSPEQAEKICRAGAGVLHWACIAPAARAGVPVFVKNTFRPEAPGTRIARDADYSGICVALSREQSGLVRATLMGAAPEKQAEARLALPEKLPRACRDGALQVLCPPAQARQVAQILHDAGS